MKTCMLILLVCAILSVEALKDEPRYPRAPYAFGYNVHDEQGTKVHRLESSDESGVVKGEYGYVDALGVSRVVNYVADHNGYRASISTNEPGVEAQNPASTIIETHPGPGTYYGAQDGYKQPAGIPVAYPSYVYPYAYGYKNWKK